MCTDSIKALGTQIPDRLRRRAQTLRRLNEALLAIMPLELCGHVQATGLNHGCLALEADSPVWATKIRYLEGEIARSLAIRAATPIRSVRLSVRPSDAPKNLGKRQLPTLSQQSARGLKALANALTDPDLRDAVSRLAGRGSRKR